MDDFWAGVLLSSIVWLFICFISVAWSNEPTVYKRKLDMREIQYKTIIKRNDTTYYYKLP